MMLILAPIRQGWATMPARAIGAPAMGQYVHPAALATPLASAYIGDAGSVRDSGRMTMATLGFVEAVKRGLQRHCPHCDQPTLFAGYLRVRSHCPSCGAENGRHRVDDIASYVTVLLMGHIVIAPALAIPFFWYMPLWASMGIFLTAITVATLAALPFIKGGVVGALAATSQRAH
jgi:uncharacterized protein (DUF983 family)